MKAYLKSIDERVWLSVGNGWERPTIAIGEWTTAQKEEASFNSKAMNAIFNAISMEEFRDDLKCGDCSHCLEHLANSA